MVTSYSSRGAAPGAKFPLQTAAGNAVPGLVAAPPVELPDGPGASIDQAIADLDSRVSALELGEAGEPA